MIENIDHIHSGRFKDRQKNTCERNDKTSQQENVISN